MDKINDTLFNYYDDKFRESLKTSLIYLWYTKQQLIRINLSFGIDCLVANLKVNNLTKVLALVEKITLMVTVVNCPILAYFWLFSSHYLKLTYNFYNLKKQNGHLECLSLDTFVNKYTALKSR